MTRICHLFVLQAVEELFSLMRLFAGLTTPDSSKEKTKEEEAVEATFRRDTIILYQSCLDGGASWTTLIRYRRAEASSMKVRPLTSISRKSYKDRNENGEGRGELL